MIRIIGQINFNLELEFLINLYMRVFYVLIAIFFSTLSFSQERGLLINDANVRWKAKGKLITVYPKGTEIVVLQSKGTWSFIQNRKSKKKGWIHNSLFVTNLRVLAQDAKVRWKANGRFMKTFKKGKTLRILSEKGGWSFVQDLRNNSKGWIYSSLFNTKQQPRKHVAAVSKSRQEQPQKQEEQPQQEERLFRSPPNCDYKIKSLINDAKNVSLTPLTITWTAATGNPTGYAIAVVKGKLNSAQSESIDLGNSRSFTTTQLEKNTTYSISISPYNAYGSSKSCGGVFRFTTGSGNRNPVEQTGTFPPNNNALIAAMLKKKGLKWKWNQFLKNKTNKIQSFNIPNFLKIVNSYRGVPYRFGGTTRGGVDCSGLIWRGLKGTGYRGERLNAQSLAQSGNLIASKDALKPGDLVCFTNTTGARKLVQHIAIYIGDNKFLHAPRKGKFVATESLDNSYWSPRFIFGVRF
tara:strand:- start:165 stop:1559 length:1395 start_codon:yes stop_codon:yes gene_type:complete